MSWADTAPFSGTARCMNRKRGLALKTSRHRFILRIVIEMLMHTTGFDDHDIAGLPVDPATIMNVVTAPLEHEKHRAVQMAVLLAIGTRSVCLDMGFDRLPNRSRARALSRSCCNAAGRPSRACHGTKARAAVRAGPCQLAIGAFQSADESALLLPALPHHGRSRLCPAALRASRSSVLPAIGSNITGLIIASAGNALSRFEGEY